MLLLGGAQTKFERRFGIKIRRKKTYVFLQIFDGSRTNMSEKKRKSDLIETFTFHSVSSIFFNKT